MACEQRPRTSQRAQMLPNMVTSEQQSLIVVKKLLAIAVSCITYLRGLFPEKAYGSKYVEEQKVMILREERSCPGASQIVQWMHGCFDALQKKYLRMVVLSIYTDPENPKMVTESYQFKIQYTESGTQMDFESNVNHKVAKVGGSDTRKASILLVRKLYMLMQNLGPLPDSVCLNMKLSYYDEVTPQEYQPPGFKEGDSDSMLFEKEPIRLTMGEVVTPFHSLKIDVTTEKERLDKIGDEEPVGEKENWALKVEEKQQQSISSLSVKENHLPSEMDDKIDNPKSEVLAICQEDETIYKETLENSQLLQCQVRKTPDSEMALRRTRSGHIINVSGKKKGENKVCSMSRKGSTPQQNRKMSPFALLSSQTEGSIPKRRRKFSEPKEH